MTRRFRDDKTWYQKRGSHSETPHETESKMTDPGLGHAADTQIKRFVWMQAATHSVGDHD